MNDDDDGNNEASEPLIQAAPSSGKSTPAVEPPTADEEDESASPVQRLLDDEPVITPPTQPISSAASETMSHDNNDGNNDDDHSDPWRNRNVILTLLWGVTSGVADSVWANTVLAGFLLALAQAVHSQTDGGDDDDNTLVGTAEAVQGMAMLVMALPVGIIADRFGKARIVAYGGGWFIVTLLVTLVALWKAKQAVPDDREPHVHGAWDAYYWMLGALAMWGVGQGVIDGPSQALFADSIPKGKRSSLMMWLTLSYLIPSVVGPVLGVVLLVNHNAEESWSLSEIYPVFLIGVLLEIPGFIIMFLFSDKHTVVEAEEQQQQEERNTTNENDANTSGAPLTTIDNDLETPLLETESVSSSCQKIGKAAIPYVLFTSSLVTSLGSGASVKYFPLFFRELGFSSAFVQGIYIFVPLSISLGSFLAQRVSRKLGRIETTVLSEILGVSLLYYMTYLSRDEKDMTAFQKYEIVVVYIVRTGLMNASYPLLESVLMDALPSNKRARWKSLEAIASFGWTGSALAGGVLADDRSYRFTFAITATVQLVGSFILIPLRAFVDPETDTEDEDRTTDGADAAAALATESE